jgi:hypothetical protein
VEMIAEISDRVRQKFNLPRNHLILNYSHNHSAPVTGQVLHLYYDLNPSQKLVVDRYTRFLVDCIVPRRTLKTGQ